MDFHDGGGGFSRPYRDGQTLPTMPYPPSWQHGYIQRIQTPTHKSQFASLSPASTINLSPDFSGILSAHGLGSPIPTFGLGTAAQQMIPNSSPATAQANFAGSLNVAPSDFLNHGRVLGDYIFSQPPNSPNALSFPTVESGADPFKCLNYSHVQKGQQFPILGNGSCNGSNDIYPSSRPRSSQCLIQPTPQANQSININRAPMPQVPSRAHRLGHAAQPNGWDSIPRSTSQRNGYLQQQHTHSVPAIPASLGQQEQTNFTGGTNKHQLYQMSLPDMILGDLIFGDGATVYQKQDFGSPNLFPSDLLLGSYNQGVQYSGFAESEECLDMDDAPRAPSQTDTSVTRQQHTQNSENGTASVRIQTAVPNNQGSQAGQGAVTHPTQHTPAPNPTPAPTTEEKTKNKRKRRSRGSSLDDVGSAKKPKTGHQEIKVQKILPKPTDGPKAVPQKTGSRGPAFQREPGVQNKEAFLRTTKAGRPQEILYNGGVGQPVIEKTPAGLENPKAGELRIDETTCLRGQGHLELEPAEEKFADDESELEQDDVFSVVFALGGIQRTRIPRCPGKEEKQRMRIEAHAIQLPTRNLQCRKLGLLWKAYDDIQKRCVSDLMLSVYGDQSHLLDDRWYVASMLEMHERQYPDGDDPEKLMDELKVRLQLL